MALREGGAQRINGPLLETTKGNTMPDKKKDSGWFTGDYMGWNKNYFESTGDYMGYAPSEGDTSSSRKTAGRAIDRVVGKQTSHNEAERIYSDPRSVTGKQISPNEARRIKGQKKQGRPLKKSRSRPYKGMGGR
jgi:hypothetical protein